MHANELSHAIRSVQIPCVIKTKIAYGLAPSWSCPGGSRGVHLSPIRLQLLISSVWSEILYRSSAQREGDILVVTESVWSVFSQTFRQNWSGITPQNKERFKARRTETWILIVHLIRIIRIQRMYDKRTFVLSSTLLTFFFIQTRSTSG